MGGESLPMVGRILGHTQAQTTARYAHLAADPIRKASERIASSLRQAMHRWTRNCQTGNAHGPLLRAWRVQLCRTVFWTRRPRLSPTQHQEQLTLKRRLALRLAPW